MVEKMKYVNITGHIKDMDRVVNDYLSKYDIQLENATKELPDTKNISSFALSNPYSATLHTAEGIIAITGFDTTEFEPIGTEQATEIINRISEYYGKRDESIKALEIKIKKYREYLEKIDNFVSLDLIINRLNNFEFIKYRFGRIPVTSYKQFESFLYDEAQVLFIIGKNDGQYIWALYFVPDISKDKVDSILSTLHFERIWIEYEMDGEPLEGTLADIYYEVNESLKFAENEMSLLHEISLNEISLTPVDVVSAYHQIKEESIRYDTRKNAAKTQKDFFIFVGWMSKRDAESLATELESDDQVVFMIEDDHSAISSKPPTKLHNNFLVKPFEFFVRMYGLPSYGELDPTPFVALTYTLIFGIMFGDVGQGAVLSLLGIYIDKHKKQPLGAIMSIIGLSSMFFGFMYGSVFGIEDLIPTIWLKPSHSINSILFSTVFLGICLIFIAMIFNIINSLRKKEWGMLLFGPNGVAGMLFYGAVLFIGYSAFSGSQISGLLIALSIWLPLVLIAFREPLLKQINGHKPIFHGNIPQFLLETIIELFEVLLSYFTNTVSFVRVGAFALSHAGMMSVVLLLSESANGGLNPVVLILGNIFVIGLEGLIVGIQVLRLEFYEMFSRFFKGNGREFVSYKSQK